jgi:ParB-like chromosome segregation protein Spo0J
MQFKKFKVEELNPAGYNPRKELKPGDSEFEKLKRSIEEFGYVEPIHVNKRNMTVVGGQIQWKIRIQQFTEMWMLWSKISKTRL